MLQSRRTICLFFFNNHSRRRCDVPRSRMKLPRWNLTHTLQQSMPTDVAELSRSHLCQLACSVASNAFNAWPILRARYISTTSILKNVKLWSRIIARGFENRQRRKDTVSKVLQFEWTAFESPNKAPIEFDSHAKFPLFPRTWISSGFECFSIGVTREHVDYVYIRTFIHRQTHAHVHTYITVCTN